MVIQVSDCVSILETWSYRPGTQKSRSRAWQGRTPTPAIESPRKQVQFDINEEVGGELTLPTGMTLFLSGGEAVKWCTALTPTTMGPIDTLQPDHELGPQWSSIPTRGARSKVLSSTKQPQLRPEGPDPVSHPHRWIHAEMLKIPHRHWWKTLMSCGQMTVFSHIPCQSFSESEALHLAHWQEVSFQLPQAQQETAGWWAPPLAIPRLHLKDYMPSPTYSNFWIMRQQKTLVLARAWQTHAEESGFPTGVLCDVVWELHWCMTPLLVFSGDEIVEASLLRPIEGECRTSPMPEEATLLGDSKPDIKPDTQPNIKPDIKPNIKSDIKPDIELSQVPEQLEICEQVQPAEQTATPTVSIPSPASQPSPLPFQKAKKSWERATEVDAIGATQLVWAYLEENYGVPKWWREFWSLLQYPCDSIIQNLACQQAMAFQIPATQLEKDGWWIISPCLEVLGWRKYLPPKYF